MPVRTFDANEVDSFLTHRNSLENRGGFFKSWKVKDRDTDMDLFFHCTQLPAVVWVHDIPKLKVIEDKDTKQPVVRVFSEKFPCWEDEEVLKQQYFRNKDTGVRKVPPMKCGVCKLWDWVREALHDGQLQLWTPFFKFVGDVADDTTNIHAGGLAGLLKQDKLSDEEKAALKKHGVSLRDAHFENFTAKATWVMTYVNVEKVEDGVVVSQETGGLGDQVQTLIANAMMPKALGREKGNPFKNPYGFQFQSRPKATDPKKMYGVTRLDNLQLTPAIWKLIRDPKSAPDIVAMTQEFDQQAMRAVLEKHCLVKGIPWDKLFSYKGKPTVTGGREQAEEVAAEDLPAPEEDAGEVANDGLGPLTEPNEEGAVFDENGDEVVRCEGNDRGAGCGKLMLLKDPSCPHCGFAYEEPKPAEPPPPPKMRSRGQSSAKPASAPAAKPALRAVPATTQADDGDEIPF